jgi:hypothetical protein
MNNEQHQEDTKYVQWGDGMYVMLDDLLCDYEKALIEDSLRRSVYFKGGGPFLIWTIEDSVGVLDSMAGAWGGVNLKTKLTRAQALYIATGDTDI